MHIARTHAWTNAEDTLLRSMRSGDVSWPDISKSIGVSKEAAQRRGKKLGIPCGDPGGRKPWKWSADSERLLRSMRANGKTWVEIGAAIGMTVKGVKYHGARLGLSKIRMRLEWSADKDALIRCMRADRKSWDQVAEVLGVSRNAAYERGCKIGASLAPVTAASSQRPDAAADGPRLPMPAGSPVSWSCISREPWPGDLPA